MPWPQTDVTHYHAQLELSDKGRTIKGLVVCYIVSIVYGMNKRKLRGLVHCCG